MLTLIIQITEVPGGREILTTAKPGHVTAVEHITGLEIMNVLRNYQTKDGGEMLRDSLPGKVEGN